MDETPPPAPSPPARFPWLGRALGSLQKLALVLVLLGGSAYFLGVVDRFDLRRQIEFETRVLGCHWDEAKRRWLPDTPCGPIGGGDQDTDSHALS